MTETTTTVGAIETTIAISPSTTRRHHIIEDWLPPILTIIFAFASGVLATILFYQLTC